MPHVVRHSFFSNSLLFFLTAMAVCNSMFMEIASPHIKSRFVIHVLVFLEYAVTVVDAFCMLVFLICSVIEKFRSSM
jgi:hypothetical protein